MTRSVGAVVLSIGVFSAVGAPACATDAELRFAFEPTAILGAAQDDTASESAEAPVTDDDFETIPQYADADSWRWYIHGGWAVDVKNSDNTIMSGGVGFEYFFIDAVSLNFEFNGLFIDQEPDAALGANFNLLFRWHFVRERTWSIYVDGGAGLLGTSDRVPDSGSGFNFTPQAGFGTTFEITESMRGMFGAKWHHISNANTFDENPGRDSIMIYAGVNFAF